MKLEDFSTENAAELDLSLILGGNTFVSNSIGLERGDCTTRPTRSSTATDCIGGKKEDSTPDPLYCPTGGHI